jgi:flagellar basal body-associated protein FliL
MLYFTPVNQLRIIMKNKIMIMVVVLLIEGCAQTPVQTPVPSQSGNSPVMQYWINRGKAEANQKAIANQKANSVKIVNKATEEPDNRPPIERYHGDTSFALAMCKELFKTAILTRQKSDLETFTNRLSDEKTKSKESLAKALETVKNAKAKEALKTYHVAVMSALASIFSGLDERKINYEQRQQALEDKVTEAWERFEIER